jgi:hypothetical protein
VRALAGGLPSHALMWAGDGRAGTGMWAGGRAGRNGTALLLTPLTSSSRRIRSRELCLRRIRISPSWYLLVDRGWWVWAPEATNFAFAGDADWIRWFFPPQAHHAVAKRFDDGVGALVGGQGEHALKELGV